MGHARQSEPDVAARIAVLEDDKRRLESALRDVEQSLLTPRQVAKRSNSSLGTLANWRAKGYGPRWIYWGRVVRYRLGDVVLWELAHVREPGNVKRRKCSK